MLEQLRMVVVRVVAAHDLASFEQRVGLVRDAGLRLGTGFATADLAALGVFPCIKSNCTTCAGRASAPRRYSHGEIPGGMDIYN